MADWTAKGQVDSRGSSRLSQLWPGAVAAGLILLADAAIARASPEPLVLRWIRVAADHPLRVGLAVSLIAWALRPLGPDPAPPPPAEAGKIEGNKL